MKVPLISHQSLGLLIAFLLFAALISVQAQYSSPRQSFTTIGAASTGGAYSLHSAVGVTGAGAPAAGETFSVQSSPWNVFVVETPGAPLLSVTRSNNAVVISWPRPADGFLLEETSSLEPPVSWSPTMQTYVTNTTTISVTVSLPVGNRFYHLKQSSSP
jgi:hypothetical protein